MNFLFMLASLVSSQHHNYGRAILSIISQSAQRVCGLLIALYVKMIVSCGCNSVVECHLPKVNVVGSSPIARFLARQGGIPASMSALPKARYANGLERENERRVSGATFAGEASPAKLAYDSTRSRDVAARAARETRFVDEDSNKVS
jgi:hypothetical protein